MEEKEILEKAIQQFTAITGAGVTVLDDNHLIDNTNHIAYLINTNYDAWKEG